jgi:predicted 3-demethylubiquinone-9 3-methyltransferase (glyoxalase superfamily)
MTKKIITHLWFDTQAVAATKTYVSLFPNSKITSQSVIKNTPSGDCDMLSFTLAGQEFASISAGPYFKLNPSISFFVEFSSEEEITKVWNTLIEGGKALMGFAEYPWAKKYGWLQDKYGVSWQLSFSENHTGNVTIAPFLMFVQQNAGRAKEAMEFYTGIFPNSKIDAMVPYVEGDGDKVGYLKHARFQLNGNTVMALDSSAKHEFTFNEAVSFIVKCDTQKEIDYYWEKLSAVPESEQCGWLKDKFGVSWQIVPSAMDAMMGSGDPEKTKRVTEAFLKMKKFDIAALQKAFNG